MSRVMVRGDLAGYAAHWTLADFREYRLIIQTFS
jgi:hypothetical protein